LALLAIIWYTILFFSLSKTAGIASPLISAQYLISIAFLLIMTLIILVTTRGHLNREKNLHEEQQQYFDLVQQAADPVIVLNELGVIVSANSAVEHMTSYKPEELVNKHFLKTNVLVGNAVATAAREFLQTLKGETRPPFELSMIRRNLTPLIAEAHARRVRNINGRFAVHVIMRDITARKNAEKLFIQLQKNLEKVNVELKANGRKLERTLLEMAAKNKQLQEAQNQLIQSEKLAAIGVLSSGIAHEIKNPLAIISLSIEEFEDHSQQLDEQNKTYVRMIKNAAERANNVIIELLRFARVSDLTVENINFYDLIEGTFLLVRNNAKFKSIPIEQKTTDKTIEVSGDRILLEQVFFNLLMNAIDSTENGGKITVATTVRKTSPNSVDQNEIIVEVTDTGSGIPAEILPKIFEPFFTTKEQGKGTGLGLSTVYTLLKRHRGTIDVRSAVGEGTTFIVTLPLAIKE